MTEKQLTELGLTAEQAKKIAEKLAENPTVKAEPAENPLNAELKKLKETLAERDKQLETLKKAGIGGEDLKKQIEELQKANKMQSETHAAELKQLKINSAVNEALLSSKARNQDTVKPLLKAFLDKAEIDGNGKISGLLEEIEKLKIGENTSFLFDTSETAPKTAVLKGITPKNGETQTEINPLSEAFKIARKNYL